MKDKVLRFRKWLVTGCLLLAGGSMVLAADTAPGLTEQIQQLTTQVQQLADIVSQTFSTGVTSSQSVERVDLPQALSIDGIASLTNHDTIMDYTCFGVGDWPSSNTYRDRSDLPYSFENMPGRFNSNRVNSSPNYYLGIDTTHGYMTDINGDGLPDYMESLLYSVQGTPSAPGNRELGRCVMLNNGQGGWDPVYKCRKKLNYSYDGSRYVPVYTYYGDCADLSGQ